MISDLHTVSRLVGTSQRTLRRAADLGLVRAVRVSERRVAITEAERSYLARHWPLLAALREALRTEPSVRLAVLFGSQARGDDTPTSDVDLLVDLNGDAYLRQFDVEDRIGRAIDQPLQLVQLSDAERDLGFMSEILTDGRVLVDRDSRWPEMHARADETRRRSEEEFAKRTEAALRAIRAVAS